MLTRFCVCASLFTIALSALPGTTDYSIACKEAYYNYMVLALTWPQEFCSENKCDSGWESKWDSKSLLIHGMWPSSTDLSYLSCQLKYGYDKYCYHGYNFDLSKFSSAEKRELEKYWPKIGMDDFWQYEWKKHGTCYLHIIKDEEKCEGLREKIRHFGRPDAAREISKQVLELIES